MIIQPSVYEPYEYILTQLNFFPFKLKKSHIKLYSLNKAYLKPLLYVFVVIMEQSGGRLA